ncbi:shikimate kinase [Parvularcula sp. ZS-1/3]|uniref:Shikimate kinase n=1 Tax=Parvularcula mediterranea TaxID=2732508 RepID=A0A7Y3RJH8_9PROT|nr:shikimate kinase [Parvularcula mediterranea]NNU15239.1 shikimate kinase [Parvularcula mediterranea]
MNNVARFPFPRPELRLTRPIVLVGLMGAGKSTTGRRLAKKLGVPFADADDEIEEAAGMRIADIFEIYGEEEFREGERKVMQRLLESGPSVLATGGGAFMNEETRALVKATSTSVWLKADLATHVRRTALRDTRPILKRGDPEDILRKLIEERSPVYAQADVTVLSQDGPHKDTVGSIIKALRKRVREGETI